jgi:hypothetical protein
MIRFECHACHTKIKVPEAKAGCKGKCPKCKSSLQVPPMAKLVGLPPLPTAARGAVKDKQTVSRATKQRFVLAAVAVMVVFVLGPCIIVVAIAGSRTASSEQQAVSSESQADSSESQATSEREPSLRASVHQVLNPMLSNGRHYLLDVVKGPKPWKPLNGGDKNVVRGWTNGDNDGVWKVNEVTDEISLIIRGPAKDITEVLVIANSREPAKITGALRMIEGLFAGLFSPDRFDEKASVKFAQWMAEQVKKKTAHANGDPRLVPFATVEATYPVGDVVVSFVWPGARDLFVQFRHKDTPRNDQERWQKALAKKRAEEAKLPPYKRGYKRGFEAGQSAAGTNSLHRSGDYSFKVWRDGFCDGLKESLAIHERQYREAVANIQQIARTNPEKVPPHQLVMAEEHHGFADGFRKAMTDVGAFSFGSR